MKRIGKVLDDVLLKRKLYAAVKGTLTILEWEEIAGPKLANLAKPAYYKDGTLYVAVKNPILRKEIQLLSGEMLDKIRKLVPGSPVKEIRAISSYKEQVLKGRSQNKGEKSFEEPEQQLTEEDIKWVNHILSMLSIEGKARETYREILLNYRKSIGTRKAKGFKKCQSCGVFFSSPGKLCPVCELHEIRKSS